MAPQQVPNLHLAGPLVGRHCVIYETRITVALVVLAVAALIGDFFGALEPEANSRR